MKNVSSKSFTKQILLFLFVSTLFFKPNICIATDFAITFNVSHYQNGNNISCNGAHDGMVEAVIVGGTSPYSYSWNTGSYNRVITGLGAGIYTFTVTDGTNQTISADVELIQPSVLQLTLHPSSYGGYNISEQGGHDGYIETEIGGGSQPYAYVWSNSSSEKRIDGLVAGNYSVIVTDANGCTTSQSQTLTEPTPLHVVSLTSPQHHGYNISCKGGHDGRIELTVDGGVPPYKYDWNTGSFDEDISDLSAREYSVKITDGNSAEIVASIQLTQPPAGLKVTVTSQVYTNGFNLSCHDCANGSATGIGSGGVSPYSYLWTNSQTSSTISGLQATEYTCTITDINGCTTAERITLRSPDRDDWSMNGNTNTDPATQYMGTNDNHDLVIKTNLSERMRIKGNGDILFSSLSGSADHLLVVGSNGILKSVPTTIGYSVAQNGLPQMMSFGAQPNNSIFSISACGNPQLNTYQFAGSIQLYGNSSIGGNLNILEVGFDGANSIIDATGTSSDPLMNRLLINYYCGKDVFVCTGSNGGHIQLGGTNSIVAIGMDPHSVNQTNPFRLYVADGIRTERIKVDLQSNWPDYVFLQSNKLVELDSLSSYIGVNHHLPGFKNAEEIKRDGIDLGENQILLLEKIEELTLYVIDLQKQIKDITSQKKF